MESSTLSLYVAIAIYRVCYPAPAAAAKPLFFIRALRNTTVSNNRRPRTDNRFRIASSLSCFKVTIENSKKKTTCTVSWKQHTYDLWHIMCLMFYVRTRYSLRYLYNLSLHKFCFDLSNQLTNWGNGTLLFSDIWCTSLAILFF